MLNFALMPRANFRPTPLWSVLSFLVLATPSLGATSLPGFPKKTGAPIGTSAVVAELAGNGELSVVAVSGDKLVAFAVDGKPVAGFPLSLGAGELPAGDLAAADMDGDKKAEIAVATVSGKLFLVSAGKVLPGFPVVLEAGCAAGPSFSDLDGDGKLELLQGDKAGRLLAVGKSGAPLSGFPLRVAGAVTSSISVALLKGELALALGTEEGRVHVVDLHGKALAGFPLVTHFAVVGTPAFGDLDDDGKVDLVVGSKDFNLYAVDEEGKALLGFPVVAGFAIHGAVALADVNDDGALEVAFASTDGSLSVVTGKGQPLPGFPMQLKGKVEGGIAVGDVDRDGKNELVVATGAGQVHVITSAGKPLKGFPAKLAGELTATPFLARVGKDAQVAAFVGSPQGLLAAVRADGPPGAAEAAVSWAGAGHDAARSGRFFPSPGRFKDLAISPRESQRTGDVLRADWRYFSVDGAKEPEVPISWVRDDRRQAELDGKRELPALTAKKGERWRFELKTGSRVVKSPEVKVLNSPPTAPELRIAPAAVSRLAPARVELAKAAADPDGDPVSYRYRWVVDGVVTKLSGPEVPLAQLKKGQRWTAVVIAHDGALEGPPATLESVVIDAPPTAPAVTLTPAVPKRGEAVKVVVQKPATDPDGDPLQYRYRWTVNGEARNYPHSHATLPSAVPRKAQVIAVAVSAFDGELEGPAVSATVKLVNTPPPPPQVAISPSAPRTGQALRAVVLSQQPDADGDLISYRAVWTRGGKPYVGSHGPVAMEVPAGESRPGEKWAVQVIPHDGEVDGSAASASAQVVNSPPTAPGVSLEPRHPRVALPIAVKILAPSEDLDGETVRYAYGWTRDGKPLASAAGKTQLAPSELKKHQKIKVTVTPSDATAQGAEGSAEVEIENTPPGAPTLALEPAYPTAPVFLKAVVTRPAPDDDADPISYRYAWYRDGALQPFPPTQAEVPPAQLKKGALWKVVVRAHDGEALGPPVSVSARIGNSPPPPPKVTLVPQLPRRGGGLRAILTEGEDLDGDVVSYRFEWRRDGKPVALGPQASSVPRSDPEAPKKGELWSVDVVASDGQAEAAPAHAEVRIANTPPTPPGVSLCEEPVKAGASLEVKLTRPSSDVDGDPISYRYGWTVGGKPASRFEGKKGLLPADLKKHDLLRVIVTPSDGSENGAEGFAECTVENTPPTAPEIALEPAVPSAETGVRVVVTRPGSDADGDPLSYRYRWTRDGLPFAPESPEQVKPGQLRRGQTLAVTVSSDDGEARGAEVHASTRVMNTVPSLPKVSLGPAKPTVGSKLTCAIEAPKDADGDPVSVRIAWLRDGAPVPLAYGLAELPAGMVKKDERWACEAWGDDGFGVSARAASEVKSVNSAPGAAQIVMEPEKPGTDDELRCQTVIDAPDADADLVTYSYRWLEDGKPVAPGPDPTRIAADQTRRGKKWRCQVVASDGVIEGPAASAEKVIGNSAPGAPGVALKPAVPKAQESLECEVVQPAKDPDGDSVAYRFAWLKNGALHKGSTRPMLASSQVKSGDIWACQVTASDGELDGRPALSPELAIP